MVKISGDIRDQKHCLENVSQALNIFMKVRSRGVSEEKFLETLWYVRGLTVEIVCYLDRPGAYLVTVLRNIWKLI